MRIKIYQDDNSFIKTMSARSHLLPKNNVRQKSSASEEQYLQQVNCFFRTISSRDQLPLINNNTLQKSPPLNYDLIQLSFCFGYSGFGGS